MSEPSTGQDSRAVAHVGVELRLDALHLGPTVRIGGVRQDHVSALAELNGRWPPVVVTRKDHTIVDGVHRFHAARLLGMTHLSCVLFDGDAADAYVEALRLNVRQGLPLSLKEREAAASQLLETRSQWSDRRIGHLCGIAHGTVAELRNRPGRATGRSNQLYRQGKDGRLRPLDSAAKRVAIVDAIQREPDASLRTIAKLVGSTASTVRRVRAGLTPDAQTPCEGSTVARRELRSLPAPEVKELLDWMERTSIDDTWRTFVDVAPSTELAALRDEARLRAQRWAAFAVALDERADPRARRSAMTNAVFSAETRGVEVRSRAAGE